MDTNSTNNDNELPWPLIVAALQGELTSEDKLQLEAWLAESPANRAQFERLERVWKEGVADYPRYLEADATRAWSEVQARLDPGAAPRMRVVPRAGMVARMGRWRWAAVAAILLLLLGGAEIWQMARNGEGARYETAAAESRSILLADGTTVVLDPETRLQVTGGFNKSARAVILLGGKAAFVVTHHNEQPFEVVMDGASVGDIGTSFVVAKTTDSIGVIVTEGKVVFTNKVTGETRELGAGSSLVQLMSAGHQGEMQTGTLRFDNARLSEVIAAVQAKFGKKIGLADTALGNKRLTVHLDGESFDDAVKVICASLNLESQADSTGYTLKNHATR
jgi:transmembrane sensor